MANQKGIILMIVLIFIIVLSITAAVAIGLMTNQARIAEYQIKRIRAFYTAEAALTRALQELRTTGSISPSLDLNNFTADVTIESVGAGTGPKNTRRLNVTVDY